MRPPILIVRPLLAIRIDSWTIEDGLPANQVSRVQGFFEDRDGNLWITHEGPDAGHSEWKSRWKDGRWIPYDRHFASYADKDIHIYSRTRGGATWYSDRDGILHRDVDGQITLSIPFGFAVASISEDSTGSA